MHEGTIWVADDLPQELAETCLVHEMTHAAMYVAGLSFGTDHEEELAVNGISGVLYSALKRNGMLHFPPKPTTKADRRRSNKAAKLAATRK